MKPKTKTTSERVSGNDIKEMKEKYLSPSNIIIKITTT
jgi:hypothetical protein